MDAASPRRRNRRKLLRIIKDAAGGEDHVNQKAKDFVLEKRTTDRVVTSAAPGGVLALFDEVEALRAEVERLADAARDAVRHSPDDAKELAAEAEQVRSQLTAARDRLQQEIHRLGESALTQIASAISDLERQAHEAASAERDRRPSRSRPRTQTIPPVRAKLSRLQQIEREAKALLLKKN